MIKKMSADLMCKIVKERPISMCNIPYCVKNNHCIFSGNCNFEKPNFLIKLGWKEVTHRKDENGIPVTIWTVKI